MSFAAAMLMQRRLVKHGPASTIIALPAAWVREHQLSAGDTVQLQPDGDKLIVTPNSARRINETTLNVDGLDRTSLKLLIRSAYRQGFSKITVQYSKNSVVHYRKGEQVALPIAVLQEVQLLIGMEVTEQHRGAIVIQEITRPTADELPNLYRKSFTMVRQFITFLATETNEENLDVEARHDLIMKIISYAMRIINSGEANLTSKEKLRMSHTFSLLGIIIDMIKYYVRARRTTKVTPEERRFIEGLSVLFGDVEGCVFAKDTASMRSFEEHKQKLRENPVPRLVPITDVLTDLIVLYGFY